MARRSISFLALFLAPAVLQAQAFGRFGYTETPDVPGFFVEKKGFRVRQDQADWFYWENPSSLWKPVATSDLSQTVMLSGIGRSPEKAKFDLLGTGLSLYFRHGVGLRLTTNQAPYLSWDEGSVGPGVPTPAAPWVLVSFRDSQPPLLITLQGSKEAFQIVGKPGDWRLLSSSPYQGWMRVVAPLGLTPMATNNAASLGSLSLRVKPLIKYFQDPVPRLVETQVKDEQTAVTASWIFDRPYAVAPLPLVLANLGGYPLKVETPLERLDSSDPSGPISVSGESVLRVRFPVRRIPTGRSLAVNQSEPDSISTVSTIDIPSIAELALANLGAGRDVLTRETAEDALGKFLAEAKYAVEPFSNAQLPYTAVGTGIDLASAYALLMQSTITTVKATSEPNSLLTSVLWRRDWRTWDIWTPDPALSQKSASLASLAAALCPEPARRLDAAMLEASLASREGLRVWQGRRGFAVNATSDALPFEGLRRALFAYTKRNQQDEAFVLSLLSDIRVYGETPVRARAEKGELLLDWQVETSKPMTLILASAYPLQATPEANLESAVAEEALGFTVLRCVPKERGLCQMRLKTPEWAGPLPKYVEPPRYSSAN